MIITVVGLGLIGGSFCKAIKTKTSHTCLGYDINEDVLSQALKAGAIDNICTDFSSSDLTIVCLYPHDTIEFLRKNAGSFKKDSIVIDTCGVKKSIVDSVSENLLENDVTFIGAHPMAGREFSGFEYSLPNLFDNASFIITPNENTPNEKVDIVKGLANQLNFKKIVVTSPEEHDSIIAFTSQLAHVVSNAYIKSPTNLKQSGFSAGSFKDLTRVARLNENMWASLFMLNREPLIFEINELIENLQKCRDAIQEEKTDELVELLRLGRILKEKSLE